MLEHWDGLDPLNTEETPEAVLHVPYHTEVRVVDVILDNKWCSKRMQIFIRSCIFLEVTFLGPHVGIALLLILPGRVDIATIPEGAIRHWEYQSR